jgi:hypothetical protein
MGLELPLVLADVGEVIGSVIALLMTLLWVLRQVFEAKKEVPRQGGGAAAAGKPAQPAAAAGAGAKPGGQQADPLRAQVEEFLRRAGRGQGKQPGGQQRPAGAAAHRDIEVLLGDEPALTPERRPLAEPLRPIEPAVATASTRPQQPEALKARPGRRPQQLKQRDAVSEHVAENVAAHAKAISEQTARLGQRIIEEDHQFDVQLKAKFDHTVGTITGSPVTATEQAAAAITAAETPAAQIAGMLANPDGVRQAIVLNEILRRPSDRW